MAKRKTLIKDVLGFLKTELNTNITDPISATRGNSSKFVMTSYPEREVRYPLITLEVNNIEEARAGMQTAAMDVELSIEMRIWTLSVTQSDKLASEILDRLADVQFNAESGSIDNDFHDFNIGSVIRVDEPGKGKTKSRIIQLNYRFFNLN